MKHQIELFMDNRKYTIIQGEASHSEFWKHTWPTISKSSLLPAVLLADSNNSISMYRALKQIEELLEHATFLDQNREDSIRASLEDISLMLLAIR